MDLASKIHIAWAQRFALKLLAQNATITCSQYGEDLVFDRLLRPGAAGTYVDVGANHPFHGSNTYRLYLRGWRGIAIDPNPKYSAVFRRIRPGDRFISEGVSLEPGNLPYYEFDPDSLNTFNPARASRLVSEGIPLRQRMDIRCRPLAEIVFEHIGRRQIDLLNVDCEGMDLDVLRSLDLSKNRPTVLILEDYGMYSSFLLGRESASFESAVRSFGYTPVAQLAWSAIFVADDWRNLFRRSQAYDESRVQNGYMPGQVDPLEIGEAGA